ncbi:unnamed protein product [Leuciscus chuanchicus]
MKAVIIIFIFITFCLISGQVLCFSVFGCTGGSLMFKCMYKNQRKTDEQHKGKYFCRDRSCKMGISTDVQRRWVYNGRFALYDDENSRFFTVFIRNLSREDDGEYTCGNQTRNHNVKLVEKKESRCGKSAIRVGYLGQKTITFRCEYDEKFKTHTKVFYRLNEDPVHVLNSSRSSQSSEEKFSLSDSHKDHFTVTIRDISAADGGVYLCGVERDGSDHRPSETSITHITFITEIQLNVSETMTSQDEGKSETTSPDLERETSQDEGKSETTSPDPETTTSQDEGESETTSSGPERETSQDNSVSSVIVVVSVGLILLAVCLVLMLLKIKYSCKHGIMSSSDRRETGDHEMVQDSDPTSTPLYSTVQLPTIPSDSQNPLYSSVQLPTIPSDSQNPLYSSIPSDRVLYASVSFQKHEESLSDATVSFISPTPSPLYGARRDHGKTEVAHLLRAEVAKLLSKGAIEPLSQVQSEGGLYSRYFLVPKKDGGLRPILDLRQLNRVLVKRQFRMLTTRKILAQIRRGDWFVSIDLKDAYFQIQTASRHRRFLRFAFEGQAYQYTVLPSGLSPAPRTFTKCMNAALAPLRMRGVQVLNYLDDWLILAQSRSVLIEHTTILLDHLKNLGLRVNWAKSSLSPSQTISFLGTELDSLSMIARLSPQRAVDIQRTASSFRCSASVLLKKFQKMLGLMASASSVLQLGLLRMRPLQFWLKARVPRQAWASGLLRLKVNQKCVTALKPWRADDWYQSGVSLGTSSRVRVVSTDVSTSGWGVLLEGRPFFGQWSEREKLLHINCLEMLAVDNALTRFVPK